MTESVLLADRRELQSGSVHLELIVAEMQELATAAPWRESGFFDAGQQDHIENLLFRFLACRHTLWHLANYHRDNGSRYPDDGAKAKSSVIAFNAGFRLMLYDASLVTAFRGDSIAIVKLNEEFYRSRIPVETYDQLLLGVTNEDHLRALRDSFLRYTAGYISDIFIPGAFKHAITYVGSVEDRQNAGLSSEHLGWVPDAERGRLLKAIGMTKLASGQDVDVIEAVGEGVIFNHLGHIMDTHINRLVVLRGQVSHDERSRALAEVFRFLGDGYDFKFDFADASEQVCTEVVYRALDGKGLIEFTLVERAGHPTLSADDIANDYLAAPGKAFEFVLFADESPESVDHQARILTGKAGIAQLTELMAMQKD